MGNRRVRSVLILIGIVMVGAGAWWYCPPLSLVIIGGLLLVAGAASHFYVMRAGKPGDKAE